MTPLVSILIPAHNAEKWIAETIRSAVSQTWKRKEIIIVDDGSSDGTLAIARRFESELIRVVTQENRGASSARNKAFSLSSGDYIQWLDADDLLAPDKISRQMDMSGESASSRTLFSSSWGHFMYRPFRTRFVPNALWDDLSPAEFLMRKMGQRVFMQTAVWLVSRELTEAAGPWNVSLTLDDDGEYFCRILLACDRIRFVPEARVYYRLAGTVSLSQIGRSDQKLDSLWQSMQLHIHYLRSLRDTDEARSICVQYLQNYLIVFYSLRPDIVEQMFSTAQELGGRLEIPRLSWKYSWIKNLVGWESARRARLFLSGVKWMVVRYSDRLASRVEARFP